MTNGDNTKESKTALPKIEILDKEPSFIRRPLCLLNGKAYAATWLYTKVTENNEAGIEDDGENQSPKVTYKRPLFIIGNNGELFCDLDGDITTPMTYLGAKVELPEMPRPAKIWSSSGVKRYKKGCRPNPHIVFEQVVDVVDRFIDFERSLASQREMAELIACFVLATWFLDAFNVIGYLWPNGERGSGKTQLLVVVTELPYHGELILAGGSYATLRDFADYGATLAFDDAENQSNPKYTDPDKRALLLAGNRRGSTVTVKELMGKKWKTRHVNTYCPRLFSAIHLPDAVLASRTIIVPLIRTSDKKKANSDPLEYDLWPHDQRQLIDDLWGLGLSRLPQLPAYERKVNDKARLAGRNLEPWRAILAVALWLEDIGVTGIWERMEQLSWKYHTEEQPTLQTGDLTHLVIRALLSCAISANNADSAINNTEWFFPTSQVTAMVIKISNAEEADIDTDSITSRKVGLILGKLRFEAKRPNGSKPRGWLIARGGLERLCISYGIQPPDGLYPQKDNGTNGIDGINGTPREASLNDAVNSAPFPDVSKPCYECGQLAWVKRSPEQGVGWYCSVCDLSLNEK